MMPLSTFNLFVSIVVVLVLYAVIDYRNKLYANIAAAMLASIIGILLAILVYIGAVQTDNGATIISDMPTAGIIVFISVTIGIYAFYMAWDAKDEYEREQDLL
jgi:high-affinity Fe2+/Pb2+ permease